MRGNELLDKMELIDPAYIEAADTAPNKRKSVWAKWGTLAACLCLVCVLAVPAMAAFSPAFYELLYAVTPATAQFFKPVQRLSLIHIFLKITEDTYKMLGQGQIQNPPKVHLGIPEGTEWESFFNTMPSYIGGDMNIAGIKWAAESKKNATTPGIPYGIDISILSDPVTVLPFCIQDGTITVSYTHLAGR